MNTSGLIEMVSEYGYSKTAAAVQSLYNAGRITEEEAQALLEALSEDASFFLDTQKTYKLN